MSHVSPFCLEAYPIDGFDSLQDFHATTGVPKGKVTKKVYELISRRHFSQAINVLNQLLPFASCTLILKISSLLGYCHYQLHNFSEAANHFERIWTTAGSDQVATWLVHCLASDGRIHEANRVLSCINNPERREALELRVALQIKAKNFKEVKKHYAQCHDQEDELAVSYSYGQYLYHRGSFSGASQIFCNIQVAAEDFVTEVEYADAACMYQQEKYSSTATKAAEIYDSIVQQCPSLAPTYDDERTMVRSETNDDNVMEGCQMAAALVLQAASYFKQGQARSGRNQLDLIPTGLPDKVADKVSLAGAIMSSEVEPAGSIDALQRLTEESSSVRREAERALLVMFLRNGWFTKAGSLIDTQEVSLKHAFTEVEWNVTEAASVASIDAGSAGKVYGQVIQDCEQDIAHLQRERERLQQLHIESDHLKTGRAIAKNEKNLATIKTGLRLAVIGMARLFYEKSNYKESVKHLQQHVDHCQDDLTYCTALAHCLFMAKNYADASFIYETIIKFYKETQYTVVSVPVTVLARYCAAQLFSSSPDEARAQETIAEILRSEKMNFEDPESEYHMVAAKRTHIVSTCLLIASTYLENGSILEACRKASEALHLHPWHLTQETNIQNTRTVWKVFKKIFLIGLRHFNGLLSGDSVKMTALIPDAVSDLEGLKQFVRDVRTEDPNSDELDSHKFIADEVEQLRSLCRVYQDHKGGFCSIRSIISCRAALK